MFIKTYEEYTLLSFNQMTGNANVAKCLKNYAGFDNKEGVRKGNK